MAMIFFCEKIPALASFNMPWLIGIESGLTQE
jgi:hypothetical protein